MRRNSTADLDDRRLLPSSNEVRLIPNRSRRVSYSSQVLSSPEHIGMTDFFRQVQRSSKSKRAQDEIEESRHASIEVQGHDNNNFQLTSAEGSNNFLSAFGKKGGKLGEFQDAKDIRVLPQGRLLITDHINSRIQICGKSGKGILVYSGNDVIQPWSSAIMEDQSVVFTSCHERCVVVLNPDGEKISEFGRNLFLRPSGLAVDGKGRFVITDTSIYRASMHEADGTFIRYLGEHDSEKQRLSKPQYVCISSTTDILVADSGNHSIKIYNSNGDFVKSFGSFGKDSRKFKSPHGICTNSEGEIFVADHYNNRISVFNRDGLFIRHIVTSEDGLVHPQGVAIDSDNHLYVTHGHLKASEILTFKISKNEDTYYNDPIITHV